MEVQEEIHTGYKQTVLGLIPNDWEVKKFKHIAKFYSGGTPKTSESSFYIGQIPFIRSGEISKNQTEQYINEEALNKSSAKLVSKGDLLIALYGANSGEVAICKINGAINQAVLCVKTDLNTQFLYNVLIEQKSSIINKFLQGGQGNLSATIIKTLDLLLPTLKEQKAIAECLSTWDSAIEKLSALISKKELQKKALMQQLLTGKKRMKGFSGEWREVHIWDIATEVSIKNKTNEDLTVLSCTKYDGLVPSLEYFGRRIYSDDLTTYKVVPQAHFAYATNHIEEGSIGYQNRFAKALISPMYTVFKTDNTIDDSFFFRLLKSHKLMHEYNVRMEGSIDRRGGLRWDAFSIIKIQIPDLSEQEAIASVIQQADKEIKLLRTKLDKLKQQKKGLMQVLLTGKKRLKFN